MARRLVLLLAVVVGGIATQAGCEEACVDQDGDGAGDGCAGGPDCDDGDPARAIDCDSPPPDCEAEPFARGCPCLTGSGRACYAGEEGTADVGACRTGRQQCFTGVWSACEGEVLPERERCNGEDDDCDGTPDEGALSPCGGCDPECTGGVWGSIADPFEAEGALALTESGELTLAFTPAEADTVWVPNTADSTVSKIDAVEAREIARYRIGGAPERVAVDHHGDAWVLAPEADGISRLTKIGGDVSRCVDRDGDGIDTSIDPSAVLPEGEDDCVLLVVPVGAPGELGRSLSVSGTRSPDGLLGGHAWVGMQRGERVLEIDGMTGAVRRSVPLPDFEAYASAFDPWGTLWLLDRGGVLARVDPTEETPTVSTIEAALTCYQLEALASDRHGALTLTGASCESVVRYEPLTDRWRDADTPGVLTPRGVVATADGGWVSFASGALGRVTRDPFRIENTFALDDGSVMPVDSTAIGVDTLGKVWVVSARGGSRNRGVASRFDPATDTIDAQVVVGRGPTGHGDLTGHQRLGAFASEATIAHVFDGCGLLDRGPDAGRFGPPSEWQRLHVTWTPGPGARVHVEARHAATRAGLDDEAFVVLGTLPDDEPPFALDFERGGVIEVRLTLIAEERLGAPRIARVGAEWRCPGPD